VPEDALLASFGCGNPTALADLRPGETVLDLGSSGELWTGCVAGALLESEYIQKLRDAGFTNIEVEPTRIYSKDDAAEMASCCGAETEMALNALDGAVMSSFVRAKKT
jgi:arsenite methyltransferase